MFGHPLGLPQPDETNRHRIGPHEQHVGFGIASVDPSLQLPEARGKHAWLITCRMPVEAELLLAGAFPFRPHMMAGLSAHCWVCERQWDEQIALGPCLGDPNGIDVPTRKEFLAWTDEQRHTFLDRLYAGREDG